MKLYHAANIKFNKFDNKFIGSNKCSNTLGSGFYLTNEINIAKLFGKYLYTVEVKEKDIARKTDYEFLVIDGSKIKIIRIEENEKFQN